MLAIGGCSESASPTAPGSISVPVTVSSAAPSGAPHNHRTHLTGDEEVPARETRAQGQAIFQVSRDGNSMSFRLIAANIENITQAHIHCGAAGTNGPVTVWLYPSVTATAALPGGAGRHDGVLAEGTIVRGASLHVRPVAASATCPGGIANFDDVLAKIRSGYAYVNVHTNDGVDPPNTGPGDFPGGEVRGQIE
jgi:hypothetical protein